ncbi:prolyl oligopeptidase [Marssonina coronariae]|uniref:Prolyl oligopeptidase n=1 Tax=Diplocarpon coronariae TaxID=2795749 RepID=A0A218Z7V9_9HELO|nr:prolyl oligopeptidase [Marssonina coronariae]
MLPSPALSFTIPSIQDDVILDCRVYHPVSLAPTSMSHVGKWNKKAAIVAHPYAPLGGSMDDPVVEIIANVLLKQNFVVGTFNFRGASASQGRTSWQAKAEQKDYISFLAFMVYYCEILSPQSPLDDLPTCANFDSDLHDLSHDPPHAIHSPHSKDPQCSATTLSLNAPNADTADRDKRTTRPRLLLAGYSYGALITSLLPPISSSLIAPFQAPGQGTAHAEIRLRAECLAVHQNQLIAAQKYALLQANISPRGRSMNNDEMLENSRIRKLSGFRMGGGEDLHRVSHDSCRSRSSFSIDAPELVKKSVDRVRSIGKLKRTSPERHKTHDSIASSTNGRPGSQNSLVISIADEKEIGPEERPGLNPVPGIIDNLQLSYLLVSPLQGIVNSLATLWSSKCWKEKEAISENDMKFAADPTLAVFGDDDVFVSAKRLRAWADTITGVSKEGGDGRFCYAEVPRAGHFWHDGQAVKVLQDRIRTFVGGL